MKTSLAFAAAIAVSVATFANAGPGGPGRYSFNQDNVRGWQLMTVEERTAHQEKMLSFKTYDECKAFQDAHRAELDARAKAQGKTLVAPRNNACDGMKAQGLIK
jgi:hypothetical protein